MTVQTIKTWHGRKWAILDENRNVVTWGSTGIGVYPYSKQGLVDARKMLKKLKKDVDKNQIK